MEKLPVSEYSERKREERLTEQNYKKVVYPKALSATYYLDLQARAEYKSKDYYLSSPLKKYASAVCAFYCAAISAFNNTVYKPINLPDFVKDSSTYMSVNTEANLQVLDNLANNLTSAEQELIEALSRNNTTMAARCNKHSHIKQLRDFAATAWLVYDNFKVDNFYHAIVDFKTRNADKDMSLDRNIALVSMGHYKAKNFVKTKVNNYFTTTGVRTPFINKHGNKIRLYENLNSKELFNSLIEMFGGYNYEDNEENLINLQQNITDNKAQMVVEFYKNYADVKHIYKKLFNIVNNLNKGYDIEFVDVDYLVSNDVRRNIYEQGIVYLNQVKELLNIAEQNADYNFILKDCIHLKTKLTQALTEIEPYYIEQKNAQKKLNNFKNINI